jgi:hypothetical protein
MTIFFICLIISVLVSYGMAIALVEKGQDFPIKKPRLILKRFIHKNISRKFSKVLDCSTCSSFWLTLLVDIIICILAICFGQFYFFWPLSGFITLGFTWTIIEYLNAIDKEQDINVFIDKGEDDEN